MASTTRYILKKNVHDRSGLFLEDTWGEIKKFTPATTRLLLDTLDRSALKSATGEYDDGKIVLNYSKSRDFFKCKMIIDTVRQFKAPFERGPEARLGHCLVGMPDLNTDEVITQLAEKTRETFPGKVSNEKFAARFIFLVLQRGLQTEGVRDDSMRSAAIKILQGFDYSIWSIFWNRKKAAYKKMNDPLFCAELFAYVKTEPKFDIVREELIHDMLNNAWSCDAQKRNTSFLEEAAKKNALPTSCRIDDRALKSLGSAWKRSDTPSDSYLRSIKGLITNPTKSEKAEKIYSKLPRIEKFKTLDDMRLSAMLVTMPLIYVSVCIYVSISFFPHLLAISQALYYIIIASSVSIISLMIFTEVKRIPMLKAVHYIKRETRESTTNLP